MAKRKSDDPTHQSRLDYDQIVDTEDSRNGAGSFSRADASTLASRRTVHATGLLADGGGHGSKRFRSEKYQLEISQLNAEFAQFAENQIAKFKDEVAARERSGEKKKEGPPKFFTGAVNDYIDQAARIKGKWMPEIGDVLTCGSGEMGQLGWPEDELNSAMTFYKPQLIKNLRGLGVIAVSRVVQVGVVVY